METAPRLKQRKQWCLLEEEMRIPPQNGDCSSPKTKEAVVSPGGGNENTTTEWKLLLA
jgi:hypothetical protein